MGEKKIVWTQIPGSSIRRTKFIKRCFPELKEDGRCYSSLRATLLNFYDKSQTFGNNMALDCTEKSDRLWRETVAASGLGVELVIALDPRRIGG